MKLQELAEKLQQDLEEGTLSFIVWHEGRKWKMENFNNGNEQERQESEKRYITIKNRIDDQALIINGKKDFSSYDLKDIQKQLKSLRG